MERRIFLSTPLRNEIGNIDKLFQSVADQDCQIDVWVIVENGSTDGSREDLAVRDRPKNVGELIVLNEDAEVGDYALGAKYARIVNRGFQEIQSRVTLKDSDLIGILDADSFPKISYYSKLRDAFDKDSKLGIASGLSFDEENMRVSAHSRNWVRGSCRLWRGECFMQSGYIIGPSADTLSLARAEIDGWVVYVVNEAMFIAREVGARSKQKYYGTSAYYRGNTPVYALLRFAKFVSKFKFSEAAQYLSGYFGSYIAGAERIDDLEIRAYFSDYVLNKLIRKK